MKNLLFNNRHCGYGKYFDEIYCWIGSKDSHRFAPTGGRKTSAYVIDLSKVSIKDEILHAIDFQCQENNIHNELSDSNINDEVEKDDKMIDTSTF
jgi:hypothetical protein